MLARREVDARSNEITAFRPLPAPLDPTGVVETFDALPTQTDHAKFLVEEREAHCIAVLKANLPSLHALVPASGLRTTRRSLWRSSGCLRLILTTG
ncbi:hypothetical protein [Streptomyces sp. P9-A2]|uniref:hypothetical protein n=1 Tax=Streptomyces sp. P9-A2 TaxID=3072284 RepID=UPI002FC74D3C